MSRSAAKKETAKAGKPKPWPVKWLVRVDFDCGFSGIAWLSLDQYHRLIRAKENDNYVISACCGQTRCFFCMIGEEIRVSGCRRTKAPPINSDSIKKFLDLLPEDDDEELQEADDDEDIDAEEEEDEEEPFGEDDEEEENKETKEEQIRQRCWRPAKRRAVARLKKQQAILKAIDRRRARRLKGLDSDEDEDEDGPGTPDDPAQTDGDVRGGIWEDICARRAQKEEAERPPPTPPTPPTPA